MGAASHDELPLYRLIEEESQRVITTALDIQGFFVDPDQAGGSVRMLGSSTPAARMLASLHDIEIQVLNVRGEVIGAYYVGEAEVLNRLDGASNGRRDVEVSFRGYASHFPHAGEIWRRWARGAPRVPGEWRRLPSDWHQSWLHVVQTAWFQAGRTASRCGLENSYVVNGRGIANTASLYCEIGEAINGPGGYFGSGLDALADCLRSAVSLGHFELIWRDFKSAEESLGEAEMDSVITVLREFGVRVIHSPRS